MSILGTRVLRTEDPRFLTTGGVYTEDVVDERLAGACHVTFVRSPIAHARVTIVDVSAALAARASSRCSPPPTWPICRQIPPIAAA